VIDDQLPSTGQIDVAAENLLQLRFDAETLVEGPLGFGMDLDEGLAAGEDEGRKVRDLRGSFVVIDPAFGDVGGEVVADGAERQILFLVNYGRGFR
jgi:hypothetical protein